MYVEVLGGYLVMGMKVNPFKWDLGRVWESESKESGVVN